MAELINYIITFLLGAAPISEVRGGVVYGISVGLRPWATLAIAILGNILAIPVVFFVLRHAHLREFIFRLFRKAAEKHIHQNKSFELYEELALFAFVAVPLPITGGYTGALISELLGWNWKKSFVAISAGIVVAGVLVFLGVEGVVKLINL